MDMIKRKKLPCPSSFQKTARNAMLIIVVPLFLSVTLFGFFTLRNQRDALRASRQSTLAAYQSQIADTVDLAEFYLQNTLVNNSNFQGIVYARTKTEAYAASEMVAKSLRPVLQANQLIGGFYTYSKAFDYFRPINLNSYNTPDAARIKEAILVATEQGTQAVSWQPITLSDRTVLLAAAVNQGTAVAVLLDLGNQQFSGLKEGEAIFSVLPSGALYRPTALFSNMPLSPEGNAPSMVEDLSGSLYELSALPLESIGGSIFYASPQVPLAQQLSVPQKLLLFIAFCLLVSIPCYWVTFRRLLLEPLTSLTVTMHAIQKGQTSLRVPQNSRLKEVNEISWTVNTMLDSLQEQKIAVYEQQMKTQRAQMQYLHLQIRPHFYLNCLNILYSLAEEKQFAAIQQVVLDLSTYLRGMFRDGSKQITLSSELRSVESYVRIQQASAQQKPTLMLDLSADVVNALVPPLCLLTFVENSFKHNASTEEGVELRIKCGKLPSQEGDWLNVVITDNCGGLPQEELDRLNKPEEPLYREDHVGIVNVIQRLRLLYGDKAEVTIANLGPGACVNLFLPLEEEHLEEGTTHDGTAGG